MLRVRWVSISDETAPGIVGFPDELGAQPPTSAGARTRDGERTDEAVVRRASARAGVARCAGGLLGAAGQAQEREDFTPAGGRGSSRVRRPMWLDSGKTALETRMTGSRLGGPVREPRRASGPIHIKDRRTVGYLSGFGRRSFGRIRGLCPSLFQEQRRKSVC